MCEEEDEGDVIPELYSFVAWREKRREKKKKADPFPMDMFPMNETLKAHCVLKLAVDVSVCDWCEVMFLRCLGKVLGSDEGAEIVDVTPSAEITVKVPMKSARQINDVGPEAKAALEEELSSLYEAAAATATAARRGGPAPAPVAAGVVPEGAAAAPGGPVTQVTHV